MCILAAEIRGEDSATGAKAPLNNPLRSDIANRNQRRETMKSVPSPVSPAAMP
jgi:hypothetical protein